MRVLWGFARTVAPVSWLLLAAAPAGATPDLSASTIAASPEAPLEGDVVSYAVTLRNTGREDAGSVYVSVEWPAMGFLVDVVGLSGAEIDHDARTITLSLPLAAGAGHRFTVRVLAPRESGGDRLELALRASHFASDTHHWDRRAVDIATRPRSDGVLVAGLRITPAGLVVLAVLGLGAGLWVVASAAGRPVPATGAGAARHRGAGAAVAAVTIAAGFLLLFLTMAWRDYQSLTRWPETTCTVLGGRLSAQSTTSGRRTSSGTGGDTTNYVPVLGVRYVVDGVETFSSGYDTGSRLGRGGRGGRTEELSRWTVGASTPCWYNPDDPRDVVVLRGFGGAYVFALLPVPAFLFGALRLRALIRG